MIDTQHIRIKFTDCGTSTRAKLHWDLAPRTCAEITKRLPLQGQAHHAIYSGSECVHVLNEMLRLDRENATSKVAKGQVAFTWMSAGSSYGVDKDFSEICWFYDIDAEPRMWEGPVEVSIFAEICEPADEFYAVCRRMRREGQKPIRIEVVEI